MANRFQSPEHSFIQFDAEIENDCFGCQNAFKLPVVSTDWLKFQLLFVANSGNDLTNYINEGLKFTADYVDEDGNELGIVIPSTLEVTWVTIAADTVLLQVNIQVVFNEFFQLECDKPFRIKLSAETIGEDGYQVLLSATSNQLYRECDTCFSTLLTYRNNEDAFDFTYCIGDYLINQVRLPFHLTRPQFQEEEELYIKSNGDIRVMTSITRKVYDLITDNMPTWAHENLKLALSHDLTEVASTEFTGEIRKNGGYTIDWSDFYSFKLAPAQVAVNALPYNKKNTLCETCEECDITFVNGFAPYVFEEPLTNDGEYEVLLTAAFKDEARCSPAQLAEGYTIALPPGIIFAQLVDGVFSAIAASNISEIIEPVIITVEANCLCATATYLFQINPPS